MKFKFIKHVEGEAPCYDGKRVKTGEVIELTDAFADKAKNNPDFEVVSGGTSQRKTKSTA